MKVVILLLLFSFRFLAAGQQANNACSSALELCPNQTFSLTNIGANKTFCPGCEDDFSFCFTSNNSIWLTFTTNSTGGNVQVDFSNLVFEMNVGQDNALQATMISASVPCNSTSYAAIGNCISNGNAPFSLSAAALPANTLYYIVVSGDLSGAGITSAAECTFDLIISGTGIDLPVPTVSLATSPLLICKNDVFSANAILTNCPDTSSFNWYVNGVLTAVTTEAFFQSTALNTGDIVSLETNCYTLCAEMVTATTAAITVYSFPIDAGPDQLLNTGETTQLNGLTTAPVYSWSPTFGISDPSTLTPLVSPTSTTTYTLTATENGCTLEDYVTITIEEKLIFPTTFSPNDDGINDRWEIGGVSQYPNCFVKIYNRWGQEIFQSIGYSASKSWDGTGNTGKFSEGVYFYIVELRDDKKQEFKGSITLIR